jgi:hypothetical protein
MARRKIGGGWFSSTDPSTGVITRNWSNIFITVIGILMLLGVIALILMLVLRRPTESEPAQTGGGAVAPPYSTRPGRINIAEVAQAPSAGQGIIYYSLAEEAGTVCDTCSAEFGINLTYTGGNPQHPPQYKTVTAPAVNGVARFDYSVFTPPPSTGGQNIRTNTTPPTQVRVEITARSTNPQTRAAGAPTSFSKTLQYVA